MIAVESRTRATMCESEGERVLRKNGTGMGGNSSRLEKALGAGVPDEERFFGFENVRCVHCVTHTRKGVC